MRSAVWTTIIVAAAFSTMSGSEIYGEAQAKDTCTEYDDDEAATISLGFSRVEPRHLCGALAQFFSNRARTRSSDTLPVETDAKEISLTCDVISPTHASFKDGDIRVDVERSLATRSAKMMTVAIAGPTEHLARTISFGFESFLFELYFVMGGMYDNSPESCRPTFIISPTEELKFKYYGSLPKSTDNRNWKQIRGDEGNKSDSFCKSLHGPIGAAIASAIFEAKDGENDAK